MTATGQIQGAGLMKWSVFLKRVGVSLETGHRWRRAGKIKPSINIDGILYMTQQDIDNFLHRAKSGEFEKKTQQPKRNRL